jgi:CheY-like chemotaxis protein
MSARLMLVDDDATMVGLLRTLLELDGFEVTFTTDSELVLDRIRSQRPDLVVMDVFLTKADGVELLQQVRATPEIAQTPVIMTSGMDVSDRCMQAGANGFVLKPYAPPDLIAMIRQNIT